MNMDGIAVVKNHRVVSHEEWITARTAFLAKEKELTRLRDELSEQRRAMPWERVTKDYLFATAAGQQTLDQLFEGRSQLVVYHAMFHPNKATARTPWSSPSPKCQELIGENASRSALAGLSITHIFLGAFRRRGP